MVKVSQIIVEGVLDQIIDAINNHSVSVNATHLVNRDGIVVTLNDAPYTEVVLKVDN